MRIETAVVEIINYCNLKCKHCYGIFENRQIMSVEYFKECVRQLYEIGVTQLVISGGEPMLLRNGIIPYIIAARNEKINFITIVSNGTIQDANYKELLPLVDRVQISIDGPQNIHDKIRGFGNYDKAVQTIALLSKEDSSKVNIMMSLHYDNFSRISEVHSLARRYHAGFAVEVVTACGRGSSIKTLTPEQMRELQKYIILHNISCNDPLKFCLTKDKDFFNGFLLAGCSAGVSAICIDTEGTIYPCARLRLPMGNIKDGINVLFSSTIYEQLNKRELFKGRCGICSNLFICGGCRARAFSKSLDFLEEDPDCVTFKDRLE